MPGARGQPNQYERNYSCLSHRYDCRVLLLLSFLSSYLPEGSVLQSFVLLEEGAVCATNASACPFTISCLAKLPVLRGNALGYCYVSVVKPGTRITPHFGPSNVKLRCHFGLV